MAQRRFDLKSVTVIDHRPLIPQFNNLFREYPGASGLSDIPVSGGRVEQLGLPRNNISRIPASIANLPALQAR